MLGFAAQASDYPIHQNQIQKKRSIQSALSSQLFIPYAPFE